MASSSKKRRAGKQVVTDEEFDAQRFKIAFHQQFYNSYVASKDIISDTREFYANARINEDTDEEQPHFQTFVRGEVVNFNMENIKAVLRLDEQLESDTNFRRQMIPTNQDLENVIQDLCV
ncbi:hypothetical protein PIB30_083820 [Stylosanthes scabra]|uniref:Uncharacterized protein n=1 Tax=Stylosanthes scabra TaxID=79078 RepID=A0ABU6RSK3_9FABA|nr:hypothetical protein [Stylosanthes scabra]